MKHQVTASAKDQNLKFDENTAARIREADELISKIDWISYVDVESKRIGLGFMGDKLVEVHARKTTESQCHEVDIAEAAACLRRLLTIETETWCDSTSPDDGMHRWLALIENAALDRAPIPANVPTTTEATGQDEFAFVFRITSPGEFDDGIAFKDGRLVRVQGGVAKPVTLKQSLEVWAAAEFRTAPFTVDGSHDPDSRAKWLSMIAATMR